MLIIKEGGLDKTTRAYNLNADGYHAKFSKYEEYRRQMTSFAALLPASSEVLDMGCGTGVNAGLLSDAGHKVTGIDSSSGMLELAGKHCRSAVYKECSVLDYMPQAKFDAIVLSFIIVHLSSDDADSLIGRLAGFLNKPGYLYLSYMSGKNSGFETTSFSSSEIFFNYYESSAVEKKLVKAGFKLLESSSAGYDEADGTITKDVFQVYTIH